MLGAALGIAALEPRLPADLTSLAAEAALAPVLLPAHLDALVQTAPEPCPSPEVALFLHGPQAGPADVQVCWRADLTDPFPDATSRDQAWIEAVAACPPAAGELMPVPLGAMRRWLAGGEDSHDDGDLEFSGADTVPDTQGQPRRVLRWRGLDESSLLTGPEGLRPGDLLVIPGHLGGWDALGQIPAGAIKDQGDRAHRLARARALLRLTPAILDEWPDSPPRQALQELLTSASDRYEADPVGLAADLKAALADVAALQDHEAPAWLREIAGHLARERRLDRCTRLHPCGGLILKGTKRLPGTLGGTGFSHEDDAAASGTVRVPLERHLEGVRAFARRLTRHLAAGLAEDIQLAAYCHDLGKADPRFQTLLYGGNPWARGPLLAKSGAMPQGKAEYGAAMRTSGYPQGGRHELLSVRLVESAPDLLRQAHDPDLVLQLIASHRGHCRPFAPVVVDPKPEHVALTLDGQAFTADTATGLERLDSGVAERFWRLARRYGRWGLAWLESFLMLADHRRSEAEERQLNGAVDE